MELLWCLLWSIWPSYAASRWLVNEQVTPLLIILSPFFSHFPDDDDDGKATTQPLLKKGRKSTFLVALWSFFLLSVWLSSLVHFSSSLVSYFHILMSLFLCHPCLLCASCPTLPVCSFLGFGNNLLPFLLLLLVVCLPSLASALTHLVSLFVRQCLSNSSLQCLQCLLSFRSCVFLPPGSSCFAVCLFAAAFCSFFPCLFAFVSLDWKPDFTVLAPFTDCERGEKTVQMMINLHRQVWNLPETLLKLVNLFITSFNHLQLRPYFPAVSPGRDSIDTRNSDICFLAPLIISSGVTFILFFPSPFNNSLLCWYWKNSLGFA